MTTPFTIFKTDGHARTGALSTAHGVIRTPAFMPVGTAATVKAMMPEAVKATGADIILGNTYHLMLRPGPERIAKLGGLHKFMHWDGPILTDSGGFQVMSLAKLRRITENAVTFQSHLDGTSYELPPERAIEIQHLLGSDISMALDECTPYPATEDEAATSMRLSMRWAERSKKAFVTRNGYAVFGIVQGGVYPMLREESCAALKSIGFDGYAVGGLAVGEGQQVMFDVLDATMPHLPPDKPRYLMGVGKPDDIIGAVLRGVDMFDCVIPTRSGRNARAYTHEGEKNIRNARYAEDARPLEEGCPCPACAGFSRAYLHHLFKAGEMLGPMLLTAHNLTFYQILMQGLRDAVAGRRLAAFAADFLARYRVRISDLETDANS
ncbi:MAG: tRNA guanosine(34) transglycosylase Tgt [Pseudomonadota bacterium]|nr:tRNA guanosine(34) transglycosylase Tgt [Pseudomonadota bacterium]MDE3038192.1 tRNA guanosine(34) transglycosylase Tgt [Pseudomonadota bacterium]